MKLRSASTTSQIYSLIIGTADHVISILIALHHSSLLERKKSFQKTATRLSQAVQHTSAVFLKKMENPPENTGGMVAGGLRGALHGASDQAPGMREDAEMDAADEVDQLLQKMQALLSNTRTQLARAVEEANQLQSWSSDEVSTIKAFSRTQSMLQTTT